MYHEVRIPSGAGGTDGAKAVLGCDQNISILNNFYLSWGFHIINSCILVRICTATLRGLCLRRRDWPIATIDAETGIGSRWTTSK
jgi:hypothetical protein